MATQLSRRNQTLIALGICPHCEHKSLLEERTGAIVCLDCGSCFQWEEYHAFKVAPAHPLRTPAVMGILLNVAAVLLLASSVCTAMARQHCSTCVLLIAGVECALVSNFLREWERKRTDKEKDHHE